MFFLSLLSLLAAMVLVRLELVRVSLVAIAASAIGALMVLRTLRRQSSQERIRLLTFLAASMVIVGAFAAPAPFAIARAEAVLLLGWTVALSAAAIQGSAAARASTIRGPEALWLIPALGLWLAARPPGHHPVGLDEVLYLLQSQHVTRPPFMWAVDDASRPFFLIRQTYEQSGYINGQYPPGWPLILSVAHGLTSSWVVLFAVYTCALAATYAFGRAIASHRTGVLAAAFLAVNGFFLNLSTMFLPHIFGATLALVAATLMVRGLSGGARARTGNFALAGLLLGFGIAMRPLTGAALTITIWLFVLLRERPALRHATLPAAAAAAGGLVPLAWLLWYNRTTTGGALTFGYDVAQHHLHALGFGLRGFVEYSATGEAIERTIHFGWTEALTNFRENAFVVLHDFWPAALIFPLLYIAAGNRVKWRMTPLLPFAILPVAHFFYFYHFESERFVSELLPFAMVGTAFLVDQMIRGQRRIGIALATAFLAVMCADAACMIITRRGAYKRLAAPAAIVEQLRKGHGKLLVFAEFNGEQAISDGRWWSEPAMGPLYWYNVYGFPGDVIVARHLGARDSLIVRKYPDRFSVVLSSDGAHRPVTHSVEK